MSPRIPLLMTALLLAACGSKISQKHYEQLTSGMARAEVETLLGKPATCNNVLTMTHCEWRDDPAVITATFLGDKLVAFTGEGLR